MYQLFISTEIQIEKECDLAATHEATRANKVTGIPPWHPCTDNLMPMIPQLLHKPRTALLAGVSMLALAANGLATAWLNASYARSRFPVPYHEAQLSFSAARLKGWYAQLAEFGTLDVYWQTQCIDFAFILTVLVLHGAALLWASRLFPAGHRGRRLMVGAALWSVVAPVADALENLVSFAMLADPGGFPEPLAWLYSGLAAVKFAAFTFAYGALSLGLLAGGVVRWRRTTP
jgi:hypothetical protein